MESLRMFDNFKFSDLDENWIQFVWDGEFMIFNEPPDEYLMFLESEDMKLLLHECYTIVKAWLAEGRNQNDTESCSEISWNTLIIMDVKVRALLAILGYIIKTGRSKEVDEDSRQSTLYAINLYFILLSVPGSSAFNVFHPNLYEQAIETLKLYSEQLQPSVKKRSRSTNLDDSLVTDESINENYILSSSEKEALTRNLNMIISTFIIMAKSFWFKDHVQSLDITIKGLLEVTKVEDDVVASHNFNNYRDNLHVSLSQNAYLALYELCDNKHGPILITITLIARYMLPRLLCSHMDPQLKVIMTMRENTIHFLKSLFDSYEKEASGVILTLIQHMMLKCPERLEARQKQAGLLIKLLGICKHSLMLEAFKNIILLSHHSKITFRLFAQEIIGKLLIESFVMSCNIRDHLKIKAIKVFFAVVLSRCIDCSSTVRGKAITVLAEFTEHENEIYKTILRGIFIESDPDKNLPAFNDLKNALSENVDLLPGSNVLIAILMERIEDERVITRRSTLQILRNLILMFPSLMKDVTPAISLRCRDPSILVRRFAVQVLSQLLEEFPDNSELLEEWVRTVVPQVFDIEIKVQEKVLEYLQELVLFRIKDISNNNVDTVDNLPWKILTAITAMKMRKHLSKACNLWINHGIITNEVIKCIQSHIGTSNNIGSWVFLVALAENIKLPNMNQYVSNYKEILEENNFCTSLVLQVLRYSWRSLDHEVLEHLHVHLYKCLQEFKINFGLISICLDIIHNIIHDLNPDKGDNILKLYMQNLIQISKAEITKIFNSESQAEEIAPHFLKIMFTLGNATLLCTYKMTPLILRILQGMLLQWDALPEAIKEIDELQPSAVVILGQQAVRDREVAKEVLPIFGRLLRQDTDLDSAIQIAVKINTVKALADICVRFTALVEPYLSDMCVSMKSSSPQVREAIMVVFIQLLLEDYIKLKGPFFFHILTMLSDSDSMIRELTIFLIEERLLKKNKTLISQQFLQSIYHYNNYRSQYKAYDQKMREKERKALTLPGKENEEKRRTIYDFMVDHLDPPGKIKLLVKITSQILGGTCVDSININSEEGTGVLKDALYILDNNRLRPSSGNKHNDDDQQEAEEIATQTATPATNAIAIIIEGMKKHGLEVLLPVLIKLREKLEILKSPLENDVKKLLLKTYSEYNKDQLLNILNEYPQLEKEVEMFKRQLEDISLSDENSSEEGTSSPDTNKQIANNENLNLTSRNTNHKVVLRRSISQSPNWKRTTSINSLPSCNSIDGWNSPIPSVSTLQFDSFTQPGPSTSTPKSFLYMDTNGYVLKTRRLSPYFRDEQGSNSFQQRVNEIQDDSESD